MASDGPLRTLAQTMLMAIPSISRCFGFNIHGAIMDGSSNNRQFTRLMIDTNSARLTMYTTCNPFKVNQKFALIQDCKHVFKKIRNSLLSSTPNGKRQIILNGQCIYWSYFQEGYMYNMKREFRYFRHLTREHVFLNAQAKMRNHLATDVLGTKMLSLMQNYKLSLKDDGNKLDSLISLLEVTSKLVDFFSNMKIKISTVKDGSVSELLDCLSFFHKWEDQHESGKDKIKHLITRETRQDIDSCVYGFVHLLSVSEKLKISLIPGYINSDLIENWFCQHRGLRNGFNMNPTSSQIAGATNTNIITGSLVSSKGNAGGQSYLVKGVMPPTKKFKYQKLLCHIYLHRTVHLRREENLMCLSTSQGKLKWTCLLCYKLCFYYFLLQCATYLCICTISFNGYV